MNYKEFVNNLFNQIARSYDYSCREQAQMSAAYDAYIGARASYSFEHERDRGHTWDIGENEVKLPDMSECQSYASKELAPYLPLIKEAFDKNLDIKDIDTLFYYIEDFNYEQKTVACALSSEKNGVLNISYMGKPSSYDFNDRYYHHVYDWCLIWNLNYCFTM